MLRWFALFTCLLLLSAPSSAGELAAAAMVGDISALQAGPDDDAFAPLDGSDISDPELSRAAEFVFSLPLHSGVPADRLNPPSFDRGVVHSGLSPPSVRD